MKKILFILMGFMLSMFVMAQADNVTRRINPGDSLSVTVKFEKVKLSKDESAAQDALNALVSSSMITSGELARSLNHLTNVLEDNLKLSQIKKVEIVAQQAGISVDKLKQLYNRNSTLKLIALVPTLVILFWAMGQFLLMKRLDIKQALLGTAIVTLYGCIGSVVLYVVLSLIFNHQYFVIKDLMSALF
jgi:hypothetical protein